MRASKYLRTIKRVDYNLTSISSVTSVPSNIIQDEAKEISIKARTYTNIVTNGNFADGDNWTPARGTESVANNTYTLTGDGTAYYIYTKQDTNTPVKVENKIFIKYFARVTNSSCLVFRLYVGGTTGGIETLVKTINTPTANIWYEISAILITPADFTGNYSIRIYHNYADAATANGKVMEVKEVLAIDITNTDMATWTADQINAAIPYWFDGTKGTEAGTVVSTGKNLFDGQLESGDLSSTTGLPTVNAAVVRGVNFIPIEASTVYTFTSPARMVCYDINKNFIGIATYGNPYWTTLANTRYIKIVIGSADINLQVMLNKGTTLAAYEPYTSTSISYPAIGNNLPNGTADEVYQDSNGQWWKAQRVKTKALQASDIFSLNTTTYTNIDYFTIVKPSDYLGYNNTNGNGQGWFNLLGYVEGAVVDSTDSINKISTANNATLFVVGIAKGTYANLAAAQAALAGTQLIYQLATPITTQLDNIGSLLAHPNGTVYVEADIPTESTIPIIEFDALDADTILNSLSSVLRIV
jgi:hypothetical protein